MVQQLQQRKPSKHCQDNAEMIPDDVTQPVGRRRHDLHRQDDDTHEERGAGRRETFQPSTQCVSKSTFERVEKRPAQQSPTQRAHKRRKHKVESDNCCCSKQNENISNCIVECLLQSLLVALGNVLPDVVQIFQRRWRHFGRHRKCLPFHVIWPQEFPLTQNWIKRKFHRRHCWESERYGGFYSQTVLLLSLPRTTEQTRHTGKEQWTALHLFVLPMSKGHHSCLHLGRPCYWPWLRYAAALFFLVLPINRAVWYSQLLLSFAKHLYVCFILTVLYSSRLSSFHLTHTVSARSWKPKLSRIERGQQMSGRPFMCWALHPLWVGDHNVLGFAPKWMGDRYVLGFAPAPRFLRSQIMCRGHGSSGGPDPWRFWVKGIKLSPHLPHSDPFYAGPVLQRTPPVIGARIIDTLIVGPWKKKEALGMRL